MGFKVAVGANQTTEKVKHFPLLLSFLINYLPWKIISLVGNWYEKEGTVPEAVMSSD